MMHTGRLAYEDVVSLGMDAAAVLLRRNVDDIG
jgi:hypothetical protein